MTNCCQPDIETCVLYVNAEDSKRYRVGKMKLLSTLSLALVLLTGLAEAQVSVDIPGMGVKVQTGSGNGSSVAVNTAGTIDSDVQMEGVAVINGEVFIDGEKIPKGKTSHKAKKSGKTYLIKWGKDGNVAVQEK